ncbi:MAG: GAF domain-containing protein [Anaerolineaceae bacterium]|nr:GAF domain-containing protein [Anaerolineaceae bacterium]
MSPKNIVNDPLNCRLASLHSILTQLLYANSLEVILMKTLEEAFVEADADLGTIILKVTKNELSYTLQKKDELKIHLAEIPDEFQSARPKFQTRYENDCKSKLMSKSVLSELSMEDGSEIHILGLPILRKHHVVGQLILGKSKSKPGFSKNDQKVIETLSVYTGIAITNTQRTLKLIEREKNLSRRKENLSILNDLSSTLSSSSKEFEQKLNQALLQILDYLHLDAGQIFLRPEGTSRLELAFHQAKRIDNIWKQDKFLLGEGAIGKAAETGKTILLENIQTSKIHFLSRQTILENFHYVACFPMDGRKENLGVLCVASRDPLPLGELDISFLKVVSSWVGTEIENSRLSMQQRRIAVLEERERIGMDLHDGVIQSIFAVGLTLEHARLLLKEDVSKANHRIEQAIDDCNSTIRDIRSYILDLRPHQMHDENLMQGIQKLVKEFKANTFIDVTLQGPPDVLTYLSSTQTLALFHICQEALANVAKHANAKHVDVTLWSAADRVLLEVKDNGNGFDLSKVKFSLGHGLSNMQIRANNVGGDVDITSETGNGTTTLAWVPYNIESD